MVFKILGNERLCLSTLPGRKTEGFQNPQSQNSPVIHRIPKAMFNFHLFERRGHVNLGESSVAKDPTILLTSGKVLSL